MVKLPPKKFRARKDATSALFVLVIFAIGGFLLFRGDLMPLPMADKFVWLFVIFGVLAGWDWLATSYELEQEDLIIRSGLGQSRIALCTIEEIQRCGNTVRLKCQQGHGSRWVTLLLKPKQRQPFLERLGGKCPWL